MAALTYLRQMVISVVIMVNLWSVLIEGAKRAGVIRLGSTMDPDYVRPEGEQNSVEDFFFGLERFFGPLQGPNFPFLQATMLALSLDCFTTALTTPQKVLSVWRLVELKMLVFSECTRTERDQTFRGVGNAAAVEHSRHEANMVC